MLERHKLDPTVALDRDGVVAEKYAANAIPQTVVIDRDGKVARLFVGGGPHLGDQLRDALKALPAPGSAQKPRTRTRFHAHKSADTPAKQGLPPPSPAGGEAGRRRPKRLSLTQVSGPPVTSRVAPVPVPP